MADTEWEFSNRVAQEPEYNPLSAGVHHLYITDAEYNPVSKKFFITFRSLETDESSKISYFMYKKDGTENNYTIHILNTLKYALRGNKEGVLAPPDIINSIVVAEVKLSKPTTNDKGEIVQYRNIEEFHPINAEYYDLAKQSIPTLREQFVYTGNEQE